MSSQSHLDALIQRHRTLDEQIADKCLRPGADSTELHNLKAEKLRLKDEIEVLRT
jgi:hypothetical protein